MNKKRHVTTQCLLYRIIIFKSYIVVTKYIIVQKNLFEKKKFTVVVKYDSVFIS